MSLDQKKKVLRLVENAGIQYRDSPENEIHTDIKLRYSTDGILFLVSVVGGRVTMRFIRSPTNSNDWLGNIQHKYWFMANKYFKINQFRELIEFERALGAYSLLGKFKYHKEIDALFIGRNLAYAISTNEMTESEFKYVIGGIIETYMQYKFQTIIA